MTLFAIFLLFPRPVAAESVDVNGKLFPVIQKAGDVELQLRGAAILRWARLVDLYAGAFYLPEDVDAANWNDDVRKHLELCYFRKIPAKGFVEASQEHLQKTLPADQLMRIQSRLDDLYSLFRDVGPDDRYMLSYTPETGTVLSLNGEPLGAIPGVDFAEAYFGIWLGEKPLNEKFRDQVLGISAS
jgi:hypothetical protein